jgi:hypothetical protein
MTTVTMLPCPTCRVPLAPLWKVEKRTDGTYAVYLCADHGLWRVYPDGRMEPHRATP